MLSERMKKILEENAEFAKRAPYNFCDRWCERCPPFIQRHCSLYQQELEEKVTCLAHGREEDDPEVLEEVSRWQLEGLDDGPEVEELVEIDLDDPGFEKIKRHVNFVQQHPMRRVADDYRRKAHLFLRMLDQRVPAPSSGWKEHFDTLNWYHTLLPAKVNRALCGFHEPVGDGDISLHDAVAQLAVCKKAAQLSIEALKHLKAAYPAVGGSVVELNHLLQRLLGLILKLEADI